MKTDKLEISSEAKQLSETSSFTWNETNVSKKLKRKSKREHTKWIPNNSPELNHSTSISKNEMKVGEDYMSITTILDVTQQPRKTS